MDSQQGFVTMNEEITAAARAAAEAAAQKGGPTSYGWITYLWVLGLSVWGGVAGFLSKIKSGHARAFNLTEFVGEVTISGLVGIVTFFLCEWAGFNQLFTAAAVGVTGHMGSRAMMLFERIAEARLKEGSKS